MNNMDTTENKSDIIGKMSFYDTNGEVGEVMQYTSATKYLNAIEKELEYNMDGFKNETLLRDPELLKKVDDLFYDAYGSDNPKSIETYIELVNKESNNVQMNQDKTALNVKNLDYLKNNLKYLGFGESGNNQLVEKLSTGVEKFSIVIENKPVSPDIKENQQVNYILDFGKSKTSDNYFLNSYTAKLQEDKNDIAEHKFFVQKGNGVTAKEAYNLLSGRAINKDITNKEENKMNVWMKLNKDEGGPNINYYNKNYGFELDKVVDNLNIKFSDTFTKDSVIKSLEKGNLQSVFIDKENKPEQLFITANPQYKKLDIYDKDLKAVFVKSESQKATNKPWEGGESQDKKTGVSR